MAFLRQQAAPCTMQGKEYTLSSLWAAVSHTNITPQKPSTVPCQHLFPTINEHSSMVDIAQLTIRTWSSGPAGT